MSDQLKLQLCPVMDQDILHTKLKQISLRIEKLLLKEKALKDEKKALLSETAIRCPACHTQSAIKDMLYIQMHWYVPPRGCTEGDYWNQGEGQCKCPSCETIMRLYKHPELEALKHLFKEIQNKYNR